MNKLKDLRDKYNLTQPRLAELSGVSLRTITRIESGVSNITQKTGEKLAIALNCTYADLIADEKPHLRVATSGLSAVEEDIIEIFRDLDKKGQEELINYLNYQKYLIRTSKKHTG